VHDRVLEELPRLDQPVELGVVDEVVVHAVDLTGPRVPRRHRDGQPDLREVRPDVGGGAFDWPAALTGDVGDQAGCEFL